MAPAVGPPKLGGAGMLSCALVLAPLLRAALVPTLGQGELRRMMVKQNCVACAGYCVQQKGTGPQNWAWKTGRTGGRWSKNSGLVGESRCWRWVCESSWSSTRRKSRRTNSGANYWRRSCRAFRTCRAAGESALSGALCGCGGAQWRRRCVGEIQLCWRRRSVGNTAALETQFCWRDGSVGGMVLLGTRLSRIQDM